MSNEDKPHNPEDYQLITWPSMEAMANSGCPCCGEPHSPEKPFEFASKCHPGNPTWVSYWDGMIFIRCAICDAPIGKVEVSRSLLAGAV